MERDENFYTQRIQEAKQDRIDLIRNAEKFARERYYMSLSLIHISEPTRPY